MNFDTAVGPILEDPYVDGEFSRGRTSNADRVLTGRRGDFGRAAIPAEVPADARPRLRREHDVPSCGRSPPVRTKRRGLIIGASCKNGENGQHARSLGNGQSGQTEDFDRGYSRHLGHADQALAMSAPNRRN
jgi:hypothetical protein